MIDIWYVRGRILSWGRWCRQIGNMGLPSMSAFMRANSGGRVTYQGMNIPPHVEMIDRIVRTLDAEKRADLIVVHCNTGTMAWKAAKLGTSIGCLRGRLKRAEAAVAEKLDSLTAE